MVFENKAEASDLLGGSPQKRVVREGGFTEECINEVACDFREYTELVSGECNDSDACTCEELREDVYYYNVKDESTGRIVSTSEKRSLIHTYYAYQGCSW